MRLVYHTPDSFEHSLTPKPKPRILRPFKDDRNTMPGKRKQIRTAWKADRKVQLASNRRKKAIRLKKATAV